MAKVTILTTFQDFNPGYSLTGIVLDQAKMLRRYGHQVDLIVSEVYSSGSFSEDVTIKNVLPFAHLQDYATRAAVSTEHYTIANNTADVLKKELADSDYCFTHDIIFTGWNLPYALGVEIASSALPKVKWFHWVHSIPSAFRDWWEIRRYQGYHKIVFPNKTEQIRVAEQFRGTINDVRVIPHIKDIRTWFDFGQDTCDFIDSYPKLLSADIVKIYPASTDRLTAKGVQDVIEIFSAMKKMNFSVCLVIANQWATGRQRKEDIRKFYKLAASRGLIPHDEFIFSSEWKQEVALGLPKKMLRELMHCANLFIFPTREESFGLVVPEVALAGGVFCVFNKSLQMMLEVTGLTGLYFDFGSFHHSVDIKDRNAYYRDVAKIILGRMFENEAVMTKTFMKRSYNYDHIYNKYYAPAMGEAMGWTE